MKHNWGMCLAVVIIGVVAGCTTGYRADDPHGRVMPKRLNWMVKTAQPDPMGLVRYDGIYTHQHVVTTGHPSWEVLCFWKSGQMMLRDVQDPRSPEEVNSLRNGTVGYFSIEGENLVFQTYTRINFGQYGYGSGRIVDGGDVFLVSHGPIREKQYGYPEAKRFIFVPMKRSLPEPDW